MRIKKNIILGKFKYIITILVLFISFSVKSMSDEIFNSEKYAELNVLDKISSKSSNVKLKIGTEKVFQNLSINVLKCNNSKFDDDPEVTAYMQVKDLSEKDKDKVFIFNDWTFASSPSLRPFDHPVYDIWLEKCYS